MGICVNGGLPPFTERILNPAKTARDIALYKREEKEQSALIQAIEDDSIKKNEIYVKSRSFGSLEELDLKCRSINILSDILSTCIKVFDKEPKDVLNFVKDVLQVMMHNDDPFLQFIGDTFSYIFYFAYYMMLEEMLSQWSGLSDRPDISGFLLSSSLLGLYHFYYHLQILSRNYWLSESFLNLV
ncbi:hypothetical protein HNY73_000693 [Argiope bruennichi]|uniref:Uncharacterized protein n=1 Tax=Argiope bruennichi TaxID=94029 RepID=A0A8T0G1C7_ARGBR|nr:hypothetical protein HNY73_000693 [Argiope bruennichi]